jgi:hypothetical protein
MMLYGRDNDIARNYKTVDWLKAELLSSVAQIHRSLAGADDGPRVADMANVVIGCYLLAKHLGIGYAALDAQIDANIRENIQNGHEIEEWYGDFTSLAAHRKGRSD